MARPNYAALGPVFGKATNTAAEVIRALSQEKLEEYRDGGIVEISVDDQLYRLVDGDAEIVQEASGTLLVKGEGATTLALDTELDDELLDEGIARELVNRVQRLRKDAGLEITDRIELGIAGHQDCRMQLLRTGSLSLGKRLRLTWLLITRLMARNLLTYARLKLMICLCRSD